MSWYSRAKPARGRGGRQGLAPTSALPAKAIDGLVDCVCLSLPLDLQAPPTPPCGVLVISSVSVYQGNRAIHSSHVPTSIFNPLRLRRQSWRPRCPGPNVHVPSRRKKEKNGGPCQYHTAPVSDARTEQAPSALA